MSRYLALYLCKSSTWILFNKLANSTYLPMDGRKEVKGRTGDKKREKIAETDG